MDEQGLPERTRLGPARGGRAHVPAAPARRGAPPGSHELAERLRGGEAAAWGGDAGAAAALASLDPARDRIVSYVGKLIVSKGVDLLLAAWPRVVARVPEARLVVVGFGTYRDALRDDFVGALAARGRGRAGRARRPRPRARGRAARPPAPPPGVPGPGGAMSGARPRPTRPSGSTSPAASSTTTCPTCCPPARRRSCPAPSPRPSAWWPPRRRPAGRCRCPRTTRAWRRSRPPWRPSLPASLRPLLSFEVGPGAVEEIAAKLVDWLTMDPAERGLRPGRAGRRGGAALQLGERGRGSDRGGAGAARTAPLSGALSG